MGNCCSGGANEGEVKLGKNFKTQSAYSAIFDDREVCGLKGTAKMKLIFKIQVSKYNLSDIY